MPEDSVQPKVGLGVAGHPCPEGVHTGKCEESMVSCTNIRTIESLV